MPYTENFTEGAELLAKSDPQVMPGLATTTGWVSCANFHRLVFVIQTGVLGANVTLTLWQATTTAGDDALPGGTWTLYSPDNDNEITIIDAASEAFAVNQDYDCAALVITPVGRPYMNVTVWGMEPRFRPVATTLIDAIVTT